MKLALVCVYVCVYYPKCFVHCEFVCTLECECVYVCVCTSMEVSLVSLASPFQKKPVESSAGDPQVPPSSARPLLMRTFSDESNTVL